MINIQSLFDEYGRKARLYPSLVALLPAYLLGIGVSGAWTVGESALALAFAAAVTLLLTHIGRTYGKRIESELYPNWQTLPTTVVMCFPDSEIDNLTKERYLARLEELIPGWDCPNLSGATEVSSEAKMAVHSAAKWLRERTRCSKSFPILFAENVSYGFRRNLYGLKRFGIILNTIVIIIAAVLVVNDSQAINANSLLLIWAALIAAGSWLVMWSFLVTETWVREAAEQYARALWAATESI